jgi:hypothetical protein
MSWIRSSEGAILGALLVITLAAVGTAAAYSVTGNAPEEAKVGSSITVNATIEDPFADDDGPQEWTVVGETGLEDANWRVQTENVGQENGLTVESGDSVSQVVRASNGTTTINVEVTGTVPTVSAYSYENPANVTALTVEQEVSGSVQASDSWTVKQFTDSSKEARHAIDAAIEAGARDTTEDAQSALRNAIGFYNEGNGNFDRAIQNAEEAQSIAEDNANSGPSMLLIGGGLVVLLAVVGGVAYVYRSNQRSGHKLQ